MNATHHSCNEPIQALRSDKCPRAEYNRSTTCYLYPSQTQSQALRPVRRRKRASVRLRSFMIEPIKTQAINPLVRQVGVPLILFSPTQSALHGSSVA